MSKLVRASVTRGFIAAILQIGVGLLSNVSKQRYDQTRAHLTREYEKATPQERYSTGANSLEGLLRHLFDPYMYGDGDLLAAYEKFSVFKNPSLPLAVTNLRIASGKHKVINSLTQKHLDAHDRIVVFFKDLISGGEDEPKSVMDRKFNKLAVFVFSNMEHADDILRTAESRKLTTPKDIKAVLGSESVMTPLMDGVL